MRIGVFALLLLLSSCVPVLAQTPSNCCTLTIVVEGMDSNVGNLGILIFNNSNGWPEDRHAALKDIIVPAQQGTQTVTVPNLPPGDYAVALIHDANQNHKIDKSWIGKPQEQWGMSNNPHATIKAPSMSKAMFRLNSNKEIHVQLQK